MEAGLVQRESTLTFRAVPAAPLRGRGPRELARGLGQLLHGIRATRKLIAETRPAAILGTGGYVCVPVFIAAARARVPTVLFLPDVVPGLAVKLLARIATTVACSVEDTRSYLRRDLAITGYPARTELYTLDRATCRAVLGLHDDLPVLLVYGGSRGARSINRAIAALLPLILPLAQVVHVCGREGDDTFLRAAAEQLSDSLKQRYHLYPYLHSNGQPGTPTMTAALGAADLTLCRSGASTLGELPAVGLPAVLIPYPYVHQEENADYMVQRAAAIKIADSALDAGSAPETGQLFIALRQLLSDGQARATMAHACHQLARPDAARQLAHLVTALASRSDPQ